MQIVTHFNFSCPCASRWWGERALSFTCSHPELRPVSFLSGSPVPVLFTSKRLSVPAPRPSQSLLVEFDFQCKSYPSPCRSRVFASPPPSVHTFFLSRWCLNTDSCWLAFEIVTHTVRHTLETPIHDALKHLVTQIICCQSERYLTLSLGIEVLTTSESLA